MRMNEEHILSIVGIGVFMPELTVNVADCGVLHASGVAGLIGDNSALGYILMGMLAFLLGVCVTALLHHLHRRNERIRKEDRNDEL